jgi:predicted alpha/beta hydrolase family esterase
MPTVLLIPGLYDSGPAHWQRIWQRERAFRAVEQRDWLTPLRDEWVATLEREVAATPGPIVLAAHSLGCATVAYWAALTAHADRIRGVLLVAPSDTEAPTYPPGTTGFVPVPRARLPFPSRVVLSSNDAYVRPERARAFAADWGSEVTDIGPAGHINADSGHGPWPEGLALLDRWLGQ